MIKHYNITVKGRVQGVFFRKFTAQEATALGLSGFVMNRSDGSVYIEAEGAEAILQQFLQWCHRGSPAAEVDEVHCEEAAVQQLRHFEIRRSA